MKMIQTRKTGSNLLANLFGRIWTMVASFIFVPLYIRYLGEEAYGLVTFFTTLQSLLAILGLGLSKTLRREFALGDESDRTRAYKYKMLRSMEFLYAGVCLLIVLICYLSAKDIANQWLKIDRLDIRLVESTVQIMGLSIALQIMANLYQGGIFGLEYQVLANSIQIGWSSVKSIGAVILLASCSINVFQFYLWYVFSDLLFALIARLYVVKLINKREKWRISDLALLKNVWKFAAGILVVSVISTINTQIDKLIISKNLSLVELGAYNTSNLAASVTYVLASAIAVVAFTRFAREYSTKQTEIYTKTFLDANNTVALIVVALGTYLTVFIREILTVWTQNEEITRIAMLAAPMQVVGGMCLALQVIPYEFLLACGNTRINNILGICNVVLSLILTPWMIRLHGIRGAGLSYMIIMVCSTIGFLTVVYVINIRKGLMRWLIRDILIPMALCFAAAWATRTFLDWIGWNDIMKIAFAVLSGSMVLMIELFIIRRGQTDSILHRIKDH